MPVSGTIGEGYIKIALAGYNIIKTQLAALQAQAKVVGESLKTIGAASAKGFALATGSITGFLKAADPVRFTVFTQKLEILGMYIGLTFIPLLQSAIDWLNKLIEYFKNLTDEQREGILHWTKIGLAVLAVGTALGTVATVLPKVIGLLRALWSIVSVLTASTGLGLVLALAAVAYGIYELLKATGTLEPILAAFQSVLDALMPSLDAVFDSLKNAFDEVMPSIMKVVDALREAAMKVVPPLIQIFKALIGVFDKLAPALAAIIGVLAEVSAAFIEIYATIASVVLDVLAELIGVLADLFDAFWKAFGDSIVSTIKICADIIKGVLETIKEVIGYLKEAVEIANSLNPFASDTDGRDYSSDPEVGSTDRRKNPTGAGVYGAGGAGGGFGGDYGGGSEKSKFRPMAGFGKVETYGLEEGFKKAQAGASFDPAKMAENERKKLMIQSNDFLREISVNTTKTPAAMTVGGDF